MPWFSRLTYLIVCLLLFQSCNTLLNVSTVKLEIVIPGKIEIPSKYKKAAIRYNNCNVALNPNFAYYFEDNKIILDSINTDSIASEIYFQVFINQLKSQDFFDTIIELESQNFSNVKLNDSLVYSQFNVNGNSDSIDFNTINTEVLSFTKIINRFSDSEKTKTQIKFIDPNLGLYSADEIQQIADSTNADLLATFDYFASIDGIFSPNFKKEDSDSINISSPNIYKFNYSSEVVNIISCWNFYDLKEQELIYSHRKKDSIRWDKPATHLQQAKQQLPPRTDALFNAADIAASTFVEFLVPHWIEVERMYYKSGHIELNKTEELIHQNRWLEAAEIWKKNTTNKNKSIAAKSMFNMAVACEMNGDMDAAIDWTVKSFYVFGTKNEAHAYNCQNYIQILGQRKIDIQKIEKNNVN